MPVLLLATLTSCSTILGFVGGVPHWTIRTPRATLTTVSFTAEGSASRAETARDIALEKIMQQLSEYVGYRLEDHYRDELIETGEIRELSASISDEFQSSAEEGVSFFLLVQANRRTINDFRRAWEQRAARDGQEYLSYRDAARRFFARSQDIDAAIQYVEAARSVYQSRATDHISLTKEYLNQAAGILDGLRIEALPRRPGDRTFPVRVSRDGRTFSGGVAGAPLKVSYTVYNSVGNQIQMEQRITTDSRGYAALEIVHPGFRGSGRVTVHLDIPEIARITADLQDLPEIDPIIRQILRLEAEKQAGFSYTVRASVLQGNILAAILEYDRGGEQRNDSLALDSLMEIFRRDGITVTKVPAVTSEAQARTYFTQNAGAGFQTGIVGSVEIMTVIRSGSRYIATARGVLQVLDSKTLQVRMASGAVVANGIGDTADEAKQAALTRFGGIAAAVLLSSP